MSSASSEFFPFLEKRKRGLLGLGAGHQDVGFLSLIYTRPELVQEPGIIFVSIPWLFQTA